jgi:hypothetical protein
MKILFHKKFQKFIGKTKNKELLAKIKGEVDGVIKDSSIGKVLEHPFRKHKIQCVSFDYNKNSFRIAYISNKKELGFLLIDSRENFYKKLERVI